MLFNTKMKKESKINKKIFNNIIKNAENIINENEKKEEQNGNSCKNHPIFNYIRLIGRGTQTEYMRSLIVKGIEPKNIDEENVFFDMRSPINISGKIVRAYDLIDRISFDGKLHLGRDLILPWPWKYERIYSSLCNFGSELHCGEWKEDELNHLLELWLPIGVAFVHGGNHSITAGIIQAEGEITPYQCVKMDKFYDYICTDGIYYKEIESDKIISEVKNLEFAAIYEIGRLILKNDIKFIL